MNDKKGEKSDYGDNENEEGFQDKVVLETRNWIIRSFDYCSNCQTFTPVYCLGHYQPSAGLIEKIMDVKHLPEQIKNVIDEIPSLSWVSVTVQKPELVKQSLTNHCLVCGEHIDEEDLFHPGGAFIPSTKKECKDVTLIEPPGDWEGYEVIGSPMLCTSLEVEYSKQTTWNEFKQSEGFECEHDIESTRRSEEEKAAAGCQN